MREERGDDEEEFTEEGGDDEEEVKGGATPPLDQLVQEGIPRNGTDIIRGTTTPNEKGKQERIGYQ